MPFGLLAEVEELLDEAYGAGPAPFAPPPPELPIPEEYVGCAAGAEDAEAEDSGPFGSPPLYPGDAACDSCGAGDADEDDSGPCGSPPLYPGDAACDSCGAGDAYADDSGPFASPPLYPGAAELVLEAGAEYPGADEVELAASAAGVVATGEDSD